jgi:POT family proton-dependent oligopeptide transporter
MMGVWFLSNSAGNKLAGWSAGFFSSVPLAQIFGTVATVTVASAVVMFLLVRPMRRLMGGIR